MSELKAKTLMAKYQAYSNAAEFIRSHGEEGFSFADETLSDKYFKETEKLYEKLSKNANQYFRQYEALGIDVDTSEREY